MNMTEAIRSFVMFDVCGADNVSQIVNLRAVNRYI